MKVSRTALDDGYRDNIIFILNERGGGGGDDDVDDDVVGRCVWRMWNGSTSICI